MMFSTLVATVAVTGLTTGFTPSAQPKWQPDYPTAARLAAAQHKPLAVFVGHGPAGIAQLPVAGDAGKALGEQFVSVYVDADSAAGRPLAAALQVSTGLVISDHTGTLQALKHQGPVQPAELAGYLATYAVPQSVTQTVQVRADTPAPVAAPAAPIAAPVLAPAYSPVVGGCAGGNCGAPAFVGGCANGRCGGGFAPAFTGGGCAGGNCGGGRLGLFR
jgi:hypothetical protein